jgi:predicted dehydrogenase
VQFATNFFYMMATERLKMKADVGEKSDARNSRTAAVAVKPKIRAGIVGAGLMGRWHAQALEKAGGEVVGVADFDLTKAARLAAKYRDAKGFESVEKMINARKIDVLHVCSPTASHEAIAETAIKAGVHLLIEKPLAATVGETVRLYYLTAQRGTLLCPIHQFAFQDGAEKAKKLLPRIGKLVHLEARICSAGGDGFAGEQLDLLAADILPHPLSLMQKFFDGNINEIDWEILRSGAGELRVFARSAEISLSIFISLNSRPTRNSFELIGSEGTIHLDLFHGFSFLESGKTSRTTKILRPFNFAARSFSAAASNLARRAMSREPAYPGLRRLISEFYDAVRNNAEPPISQAEAIAVAEVRDSLMARAGIGRKI